MPLSEWEWGLPSRERVRDNLRSSGHVKKTKWKPPTPRAQSLLTASLWLVETSKERQWGQPRVQRASTSAVRVILNSERQWAPSSRTVTKDFRYMWKIALRMDLGHISAYMLGRVLVYTHTENAILFCFIRNYLSFKLVKTKGWSLLTCHLNILKLISLE